MSKLMVILCAFAISISPIFGFNNQLSGLKENCCCKKICECNHKKASKIIFRSIKCGDNLPSQIVTNNILINVTTNNFSTISWLSPLKTTHTFFFELMVFSLDPPPPKQFDYC